LTSNAEIGATTETAKNSNLMDEDDILSLNPQGQFGEEIAEWRDGQEYDLKLRVRQTAPGKFAVTTLTYDGEVAEPMEPAKSKTGNPAIDGMME